MIDATCLAAGNTEYFAPMFSGGFVGLLLGMVIVAAFIAVAVAPLVMRRYDAQVRRLMRMQQCADLPPAFVATQSHAFPHPLVGSDDTSDPPDVTELDSASRSRLASVRRATWAAYGAFVVAGIAIVPIGHALAVPDRIGYFLAVWFVGAVPALVNVRPQGSKTVVLIGSVVLGLVLGVLEAGRAESELSDVIWAPGLLAALYFTIAHRTLRSVVIPLTLLVTVVLSGVIAASWFFIVVSCVPEPASAMAWSLVTTSLASGMMALGGSVYAGRKAVDAMARLQERGVLSDISISAGIGVTFIALLFAVALGFDSGLAMWQLGLVGAVWAGLACAAYAAIVRRGTPPVASRSLLVLRVFSRSKAAERLLDAVQTDWRYVGPVYQIAGPDLIRLNVDLYEFGKFVNAKLHELFLFGAVSRDQLLGRLVRRPDREGRFRVNEIFCFESAWRATVEQLMDVSDAILLDVRGFGPERKGTAFELELLVRRGFTLKVVALGDRTTNWDYFDQRIRDAGGDATQIARELIAGRGDSSGRFVSALMRAATGRR